MSTIPTKFPSFISKLVDTMTIPDRVLTSTVGADDLHIELYGQRGIYNFSRLCNSIVAQ
jgi:hypothetical protein